VSEMKSATQLRRRPGRSTIAAAAVVCAMAALPATASAAEAGDGALSPRLVELAKPAVRSAPPTKQARMLSVAPAGPGSLLREGDRVLVDVRFAGGAVAGLEALRSAGAQIVSGSRRYQTATVAVAPASLRDVADVARVQSVTEDLAPIVYGVGESPIASVSPTECEGGAAISEGVEQLQAKKARTDFSVTGNGVTVGVLSDSFDKDKAATTHATKDIETGDLPGPAGPCTGQKTAVKVVEDLSGSKSEEEEATDEGRAMLQIVHDVAPGAPLAFATAFKGETSFAQNIEKLAKPVIEGGAGAKVIVDDVAYFSEPFFQDGPIAAAVKKVTDAGVPYFSAAGNNNLFDTSGHEIASWEAPRFRDSSNCPAAMAAIAGLNASHCMDFDPGAGVDNTFGITVAAGATLTVDLQWAEPWNGVTTDLDALLLDSNGAPVLANSQLVGSGEDNINGSQKPFEFFQWKNTTSGGDTVQLAINRFSGGSPRLKFALMENGGGVTATEYPTSIGGDEVGPTLFGHSGSSAAISVAAVHYNTTTSPESYSSRGPVTHYFAPVAGSSPAAALPSPQTISKPDIAATDCGATTFFVPPSFRFCGTSAAAPHAAGIAALMSEKMQTATVGEIRSALLGSAAPVGAFGQCAVGAGLVNAPGAIERVPAPQPAPLLSCLAPASTPLPEALPAAAAAAAAALKKSVQTSFTLRPHRVVRTHARSAFVSFRFGSDQGGAFLCSIDRVGFHPCQRKLARWFSLGPHAVRVVARNAAGETDPTPAVFNFRVEHVK
jgi:subtilase family protein